MRVVVVVVDGDVAGRYMGTSLSKYESTWAL